MELTIDKEMVTIGDITYEKFLDENELICLKRYNPKTKRYTTLRFPNEEKHPNIDEEILEIMRSPNY